MNSCGSADNPRLRSARPDPSWEARSWRRGWPLPPRAPSRNLPGCFNRLLSAARAMCCTSSVAVMASTEAVQPALPPARSQAAGSLRDALERRLLRSVSSLLPLRSRPRTAPLRGAPEAPWRSAGHMRWPRPGSRRNKVSPESRSRFRDAAHPSRPRGGRSSEPGAKAGCLCSPLPPSARVGFRRRRCEGSSRSRRRSVRGLPGPACRWSCPGPACGGRGT